MNILILVPTYQMLSCFTLLHEGIIYRCDKCDYRNSRKQALNSHINAKHKGTLYKCDQCEVTFKYVPNLRRHKVSIHDVTVNGDKYRKVCPQCGLKCRDKNKLKEHIRVFHQGHR